MKPRPCDGLTIPKRLGCLLAVLSGTALLSAAEPRGQEADMPDHWPTPIPEDCPFERSRDLRGVALTGRHRSYPIADYFYPSWAADGHLYTGCGDGKGFWNAGIIKIVGDDPLRLDFQTLGNFNVFVTVNGKKSSAGVRRYHCASLLKDGVWYYGLEDGWNTSSDVGVGRFWGFLRSSDYDRVVGQVTEVVDGLWRVKDNPYWKDPTGIQAGRRGPRAPFGEYPRWSDGQWPAHAGGFHDEPPRTNRIRNPHFVDFGRNMEHSPDGYAYMTTHGCEGERPAEWGNGDSIYLLRARPERIVQPSGWQFFAGLDPRGEPVWVEAVAKTRPLLTWKAKLGHASVVFNKPLGKYLMCVAPLAVKDNDTNGPKLFAATGCLLLEADRLAGPWRVFQFLGGFGPNAYAMSMPSKFLSPDGRTAWLLYSAGWGAKGLPANPPGSSYAACFQEILIDCVGARQDGRP